MDPPSRWSPLIADEQTHILPVGDDLGLGVQAAGRVPVQRDTLYRDVKVWN